VEPRDSAKSMGHEETYPVNIKDPDQLKLLLLSICERVGRRLRRHGLRGYTVNIKARYPNFQTVTRSKTMQAPTNDTLTIFRTAHELLEKTEAYHKKIRLIGVSVSHFAEKQVEQLTIFEQSVRKRSVVTEAFDRIRDRFGEDTIKRASLLDLKDAKKNKSKTPRSKGNNTEPQENRE
jgi:DNA polymerase-4